MNIHVKVEVPVFRSFRYMPKCGLAGSCGNSTLNFLRNLQTFAQQLQQFAFAPTPHPGGSGRARRGSGWSVGRGETVYRALASSERLFTARVSSNGLVQMAGFRQHLQTHVSFLDLHHFLLPLPPAPVLVLPSSANGKPSTQMPLSRSLQCTGTGSSGTTTPKPRPS